VRALERNWINTADSVALFLDEVCTTSKGTPANQWALVSEVHKAFLDWARDRRHGDMSRDELTERLISRGIEHRRSNGARLSLSLRPRSDWDGAVESAVWDEDETPF
jgi:hypothetical protein